MKLQSTIRHICHAQAACTSRILSHAFSTSASTSHATDREPHPHDAGASRASAVDTAQVARDENPAGKGCRVGIVFNRMSNSKMTEEDIRAHLGRFGDIREVVMRPRLDRRGNDVIVYFDTVKTVDDAFAHICRGDPFKRFKMFKTIRGWPHYDEKSLIVANLPASVEQYIIAGLFAEYAVSSVEMLTSHENNFLGYAKVTFENSTISRKVFARAAKRPLLVEGKALTLIPCGWLVPVEFRTLLVSGLLRESDTDILRGILQEFVKVKSIKRVYLSDETFGHAACVRFFSEYTAKSVLASHRVYPLEINGRKLDVTHLTYFQRSSKQVLISFKKKLYEIIDAEREMESARSLS